MIFYKNITTKFKNKLVILDNASSHINTKIKKLVNKYNNLLYPILYKHFLNCIENFFSILKSRLQKLEGLKSKELKYEELKKNIIRGIYKRPIGFIRNLSNRTRKLNNYKIFIFIF
jgi:hypothetical protein